MIEDFNPPVSSGPAGADVPAASTSAAASNSQSTPLSNPLSNPLAMRVLWVVLALLGALSLAGFAVAWNAAQRGASLEQELVRRQTGIAADATEARTLARQAQENANASTAKVALLEARIAEVAVQRGQLEELIQSLSRSRDENLLVDVEAGIRVALQQTAITGSAEPLVATLKQSDERLARNPQPRLEGVRRSIARDLDRIKATSVADINALGIKLDEAIRLIDELPLLAVADARATKESARSGRGSSAGAVAGATAIASAGASAAANAGSATSSAGMSASGWAGAVADGWSAFGERVWGETKSLVRVTRIEHPEAMLIAPDQTFFIRENLKLRLLNARLALLSRQFDTAQADLQAAQTALDRYFDRSSKRTLLTTELLRQVAGQARQVVVPKPDDTLAALMAATAGR